MSYLRSRHNLQYIIIGIRFRVHPQRVCDIDHGSHPRTIREYNVQEYLFRTPLSPSDVLNMQLQNRYHSTQATRHYNSGIRFGLKNLLLVVFVLIIAILLYLLSTGV